MWGESHDKGSLGFKGIISITLCLLIIGSGLWACASTPVLKPGSWSSHPIAIKTIGAKFSIHSHILDEGRSFWVYLPQSYDSDDIFPKKYPVLFLLDGASHFTYASGVVDFMSAKGAYNNYQIPETIIVAINNRHPDDRFKDYSPTNVASFDENSGGGDKFLRFIKEELMPHIDQNFRTLPLNIIAGHSMGGLLVVYDFFQVQSLFQAHIAMDPSIWWDNMAMFRLARSSLAKDLHGPLYVSTYGKAQRREEYREFVKLIDEKNAPGVRTKFQVFHDEKHGSLPLLSLYYGLLHVFDGYRPPLNDFVEDPESIKKHFDGLSVRLGMKFLPPEDLIHDVCSHTIIEKPEKAAECFKVNVQNYPQSYNAYNALGAAYAKEGKIEMAIESYQRSLELNPGNKTAENALAQFR